MIKLSWSLLWILGLSRRMSFKSGGPGPSAADQVSKFAGNEMIVEKLNTFRAKQIKEEKIFSNLDSQSS